jgi:hypothetical protein
MDAEPDLPRPAPSGRGEGSVVPDRTHAGMSAKARFDEWFNSEVINPIEDFQDASQEWRRLFSELLGTFFLVLVAAGGGRWAKPSPTRSGEPRR